MNDYGSGMMPIVGRYGPVITAVLVDWFLRLKYGVFACFPHWRSLFKLDRNQTWYEWWRGIGDQFCLMTSWWRHYWLHSSLISDGNCMFLLITRSFLTWFWCDLIGLGIHEKRWTLHIMMTSSQSFRFTDFGRKSHVYTYNLSFSHPILMRLHRIDHTLIQINCMHHDDVITSFPDHWFRTKTASLQF